MGIASSIAAVLCFGLPDYLPGKRAFAVELLFFHALMSAVFLQASPSILAVTFPKWAAEYLPAPDKIPFTKIIGVVHGLISLVVSGWCVRLVSATLTPTGGRRPSRSCSALHSRPARTRRSSEAHSPIGLAAA